LPTSSETLSRGAGRAASSDAVIRVDGLGKRYRIGRREAYRTLRESLSDALTAPVRGAVALLRRSAPRAAAEPAEDSIWALKDVGFEVRCGEVVGVIGGNGAGKSTLLKILSRITEPTEGRADIRGRIASLLEVGTGFHPELTGRENLYLNGAILGMRRAEIERKFDEIVDFSGVERFIDTPVKRYSSGMAVRLAFAVAAHLEPEILLVDEVLAVGDAGFQKKCLGKMSSIVNEGRTVLFVSHNMPAVRALCHRALYLEGGTLVLDGDTERVAAKYLDQTVFESAVVTADDLVGKIEGVINRANPTLRFRSVAIVDAVGTPRSAYDSNEPIRVAITYECVDVVHNLGIIVLLVDDDNRGILGTTDADDVAPEHFYRREPGLYRSTVTIPTNTLGEKRFYLTVHLINPKNEHLVLNKVLPIDVRFAGYNHHQAHLGSFVRPPLEWHNETLKAEAPRD